MIANTLDDVEVVLDHEERGAALVPQADDVLGEPIDEGWVDPCHRLVENEQPRIGHHRPGELEEALLAAAQISGIVVAFLVEAELGQHLDRPHEVLALLSPEPGWSQEHRGKSLAGLALGRHHEVLEDRHRRVLAGDLERPDQPGERHLVAGKAGDVMTVEDHPARLGAAGAGDGVDEGGLPCPVRPDQGGDRPASHTEAAAPKRLDPAEAAA